jgi:hypothetical protein
MKESVAHFNAEEETMEKRRFRVALVGVRGETYNALIFTD